MLLNSVYSVIPMWRTLSKCTDVHPLVVREEDKRVGGII